MNREQAWSHYFATGDREPLTIAYWKSIWSLVWKLYPHHKDKEDMFQWGMIGLLKAIRTIDPDRVKSVDAWVWLNVRGVMNNYFKLPPTYTSFDTPISDTLTLEETLGETDTTAMQIDVLDALRNAKDLDDARKVLTDGGYSPNVRKSEAHIESQIARCRAGLISLRGLARELGITRREAYNLTDSLPDSWKRH